MPTKTSVRGRSMFAFALPLLLACAAIVGCTEPAEREAAPGSAAVACDDVGTTVIVELGLGGFARAGAGEVVVVGDDGMLQRIDGCPAHPIPLDKFDTPSHAAIGGTFVYVRAGGTIWRTPLTGGNRTFVATAPPSSFLQQGEDAALLVETGEGGLQRVSRLGDGNEVLFERDDQLEGKGVKLQEHGTNGLYLSVLDEMPPPLPDTPVERVPWTILRVPVGATEPVPIAGAEAVFSIDVVGDDAFVARAASGGWEIVRVDGEGVVEIIVPAAHELEGLTQLIAAEDRLCWRSEAEAIVCRRVSPGAPTVAVTQTGDMPAHGIFLDGDDVYWERLRPMDVPRKDLVRTRLAD